MSYQVLARKYRPANFGELAGQEHVLQALINALDNERLHHAYLFTGTRGVGKTTIARILARCLNCETGVTSTPCGECNTCREISEGRSVDLIEVDAASRTGVDDMRELLDNVQYMPTVSRFKIYLIDEVHMLSKSSFNAMLKTLEEPPEHVKFLFATTDPKKLPITVLSRCLQFNLKNLTPEQIVRYLGSVLDTESIAYDDTALWHLGRAADGSMRDALSLTDQAISFSDNAVREGPVKTMLGSIDHQEVYEILDAIIGEDGSRLLSKVAALSEYAPDFSALLDGLLAILHRVAIAQTVPDALDNAQGDRELVLAAAGQLSPEQAQLLYQIGLIGQRDLPLAPQPRIGFEMVLLRMLAFLPEQAAGGPDGNESGGKSASEGVSRARAAIQAAPAAQTQATSQAASPNQELKQESNQSSTSSVETPKGASPLAQLLSVINGDESASPQAPSPAANEKKIETVEAVELPVPEVKVDPPRSPKDSAEEQAEATSQRTPAETAPVTDPVEVPTVQTVSSQSEAEPESLVQAAEQSPEKSQEQPAEKQPEQPEMPELNAFNWPEILSALELTGVTRTLAANCLLEAAASDHCQLKLNEHHASLWNTSHEKRIASALSDAYGRQVRVSIEVGEIESETPAQLNEREREQNHAQAVADIESDEGVQQLIERFNGRLDPESISPLGSNPLGGTALNIPRGESPLS